MVALNFVDHKLSTVYDDLQAVSIGLLVCYIPRMYYLSKLCGWVCCGGRSKDSAKARYGLVEGINALMISQVLSVILTAVIVIAIGVKQMGDIGQIILSFVISIAMVIWWRHALRLYH